MRLRSPLCGILVLSLWTTPALAAEPVNLETPITRAAFTQLLVKELYGQPLSPICFSLLSPSRYTLLFSDVSRTEPYALALCTAMQDGIVRGYLDGSFRPDSFVTFAEAAKMLSRAYVLAPYGEPEGQREWFLPYAESLAVRNAIPETIDGFDRPVTIAEVKEMIARIEGDITWEPSLSVTDVRHRGEQRTFSPTLPAPESLEPSYLTLPTADTPPLE
jgi:hypothetical protein